MRAFLLLPATVLVAHARNIRRDDPDISQFTGGITFPPQTVCSDNAAIKGPFGPTDPITVQNDCDTAINIVCTYAFNDYQANRQMNNIKARAGEGFPCEATILFSQPKMADPFDYASCVANFLDITTKCSLIGASTAKWAAANQQAGVRNVIYTPEGLGVNSTYPRMKASNVYNHFPGYLIGPPDYFGKTKIGPVSFAMDVTDVYKRPNKE
ncbi:MAG: hypothetical protein Q9208_000137 [Pyrenodesmia sp. 3 TL-2023]